MKSSEFRLPKTKVGELTFKKIIKTGRKLFAKNGFQATSTNEIIEKSNVAAGTFYLYFDNKLSLYLYLLHEYKLAIRQSSSTATIGYQSRFEMEREGLKAFIKYVKKDPLAYKLIWESMSVDPKIFQEYYQTFAESYIYHLRRFVDNGQVRGDIDLETVAFVLMGVANFVGLQILFKDEVSDVELDRIVNEAMKILDGGIFRQK